MKITPDYTPTDAAYLTFHPACVVFPEYGEESYLDRLSDYRDHPELADGTAVSVVTGDDGTDQIIDGRHHYRICRELGYPIRYERIEGTREELSRFARHRNANRRHNTPSQIAAALVGLHTWTRGGDRGRTADDSKGARAPLVTQQQAADEAGISRDTVKRAAKVAKKAPEVLPAVRDGKLDVKTAAKVADLPMEKRAKIVAADDPKRAAKKALSKSQKQNDTVVITPSESDTAGVKLKPPPERDAWGILIQPHAVEVFAEVPRFKAAVAMLRKVQAEVTAICRTDAGRLLAKRCSFHKSDNSHGGRFVLADLDNALATLELTTPAHTDCPYFFNTSLPHKSDDGSPCPLCLDTRTTGNLKKFQVPEKLIDAMKRHYEVGAEKEAG